MKTALQISSESACPTPALPDVVRWVECALAHAGHTRDAQISLRIVEENEMRELNLRYRGLDKPTNVLAFSAGLPAQLAHPLLGDIVICAPIVEHEAREQDKIRDAHWAHMMVHGTLHLLGYDHQSEAEALAMETLETDILNELTFPPPYADHQSRHPDHPPQINQRGTLKKP